MSALPASAVCAGQTFPGRLAAGCIGLLCVLLLSGTAAGQGLTDAGSYGEAGRFALDQFSPADYGEHPQNWAFAQDARGVLYVGNGNGLLTFDGVSWTTYEIANRTVVRSVATDAQGRVFVGGKGEIGRLVADSLGRRDYLPLRSQIPPEARDFTDVWRIVPTSSGVFFSTRERLFRWTDEGGFTTWTPEAQFALGFAHRDTFYTVDPARGLLRVEGDSLTRAPGGDAFLDNYVLFALPQDDGLLLWTQRNGFVRYRDDGTVTPFSTEVDEALLQHRAYHGQVLPDGTLALGTRQGGLYLLHPSGDLIRVIDEAAGLRSQQIMYTYLDGQHGLWLAFTNGLARIDVTTAHTHFDKTTGLPGMVLDVLRHDGALHASTTMGVFRLETPSDERPSFAPVDDLGAGQCFSLLSTDADLLAACEEGIYRIDGTRARQVHDANTRLLYRSEGDSSIVYASQQSRIGQFTKEDGVWRDLGALPEAPAWVLSMAEDDEGALWLSTATDGVYRLARRAQGDETVVRHDTSDGLPHGWSYLAEIGGDLVAHTVEGVYRIRPAADPAFVPDTTLGEALPYPEGEVFRLHEDRAGDVWFANQGSIGRVQRQDDGTFRADTTIAAHVASNDVFAFYPEPNGIVWVGTADGLYRLDRNAPASPPTYAPVLIRRVTPVGSDSLLATGLHAADTEATAIALDHTTDALRFSFAAPTFNHLGDLRYQTYLNGFDRTWSAWTGETTKDYTNLPPGAYTFRVRARGPDGVIHPEGRLAFSIAPPWYRTWWAYLLAAVGASALVGGLAAAGIRWRLRRLRKRSALLETKVEERTEQLERANQHLKAALEQNNEFLGIAAHDLKNPLASVIGFTDLLQDEYVEPDSDVAEIVALIRTNGQHMLTLIEDLLDAQTLEARAAAPRMTRVDLTEVAHSVLRWNENQAASKDIDLHLTTERPVYARADQQQMERVLDNLVSNAIKFSPSGRSVWVDLQHDDGPVEVAVRDQGPGLTEQDKERLFGKLQRLSARPTSGESSTGMGLYIVRTLVEMQGGDIKVDSEPGQGATFTISLPPPNGASE